MNSLTLELSVQALEAYAIEGTEIKELEEAKRVVSDNILTVNEIITHLITK